MDYITEERLIELLGAMEGRIKKNADDAHAKIGVRIDGLCSRMDGLDTRMDGLDTRMDGLDTRMDGLDTRMDGLDSKIGHLAEDVKRIDRNVALIIKVLPSDM